MSDSEPEAGIRERHRLRGQALDDEPLSRRLDRDYSDWLDSDGHVGPEKFRESALEGDPELRREPRRGHDAQG
jgi:hypothetical protein